MRQLALTTLLLTFLSQVFVAGAEAGPEGAFYTRLRANDAPLGGRFSVFAYYLDALDAGLKLPEEPGRVLILIFRDANGKNSFLIPGDLALEDARGRRHTLGFMPLGRKRLGGAMGEEDVRYGLWWVPREAGPFRWSSPTDLTLFYGFTRRSFYPLPEEDLEKAEALVPWDLLEGIELQPGRSVTTVDWKPDPFTFDKPPEVKTLKQPRYPKTAKQYDFEGTVRVVAHVSEAGVVTDVFVVQTGAVHELNVSALVAVKDWTFRAGRKDNRKTAGEVLIPIRFAESENP